MTPEQDFPPVLSPENPTTSQQNSQSADSSPKGEGQEVPRPRRRATRRAAPDKAAAHDAGNTESAGGAAPRRRGRRPATAPAEPQQAAAEAPEATSLGENAPASESAAGPRRGRPRGRAKSKPADAASPVAETGEASAPEGEAAPQRPRRGRRPAAPAVAEDGAEAAPRRRARRSSAETQGEAAAANAVAQAVSGDTGGEAPAEGAPASSRPRRSRGRGRSKSADAAGEGAATAENVPEADAPAAAANSSEAEAPAAASAEAPAAEAGETAEAEAGEGSRRRSRRGRRGGRGRGHKNRAPEGHDEAAEAQAGTAGPGAPEENAPAAEDTADAQRGEEGAAPDGGAREGGSAKKSTAKKSREKAVAGNKRMFISVLPGEQVEVALAENGVLLEYYLDMLHQRKLKGNIYKGVIHNIDANLQAAFVNYGVGKNGFLQIDEVHPEYWLAPHEPAKGKKFPPIQKVLKAGQEVLVQVVKEPTGNKGAFLTTWLSLAGRFLVLTPGQEQIGVSRKVNDEEERARLREMMNGIDPGSGLGVIVRTVSAGTTKATLKNDLQYLKRLWKDIRKKATEVAAPALVHQEPGLSERAVRDYLTEDVGEIWVDNEAEAENVRGMVSLLFPRRKDLVRLYEDVRQSLWDRFNLRRQLEQIYSREVVLPSGGRLVFDQTEALMAVDINSGKISGKGNFEAMAFKTNMEAAEAIARHLRLRDIGGQVVIDFIEMRDKKHVVEVEKTLRQAMKNDRARHDVARMSSFGLLELVRQRMGSSALSITLEPCPACGGTGLRRNLEWRALQALRDLQSRLQATSAPTCVYEAERELGLYLLNHKRDTLRDMEQLFGKCLEISIQP